MKRVRKGALLAVLLGAALVLTAAVLLGLVQFGNFGPAMSETVRKRTAAMGIAAQIRYGRNLP